MKYIFKYIVQILLSIGVVSPILGQSELSNLHLVLIPPHTDTLIICDEYIMPNSVEIFPTECIDQLGYKIGEKSLYFESKRACTSDSSSILASYRTFPKDLKQKFCLIDSTDMESNDRVIDIAYDLGRSNNENNDIIASKKLEYQGSFSRGLAVGNSQDLVLNSNFDMTLQGNLGGGLMIKGVISDENIPIQAEGNTQQLREFDRVFIELWKDRTYLKAGDYILQQKDLYFSRYYKKLQGASLGHGMLYKDKNIDGNISYAVSKGKFARQTLEVQEGNQGPYKLTGNDGERFLIILSGTERVYSDGKLLTRGEQYDYVIDYNNAEVEFTINHIINAFSRIIVEYEYTDQNFLRSLYAGNTKVSGKNWQVGVDFYSEQDNTNLASFGDIDSLRLEILQNSGDNPNESVVSGIFIPEEVDEESVLYSVEFDETNGIEFLQYSSEREGTLVGAVFSEVDQMTGNYVIDEELGINQRVYKYVGPLQGNYSPQIQLISPKQKQLINIHGQIAINETSNAGAELAISNNDLNRFSEINNEDNTGAALTIFHEMNKPIGKKDNWRMSSKIMGEYALKEFTALNFYRATEFSRIWSLEETNQKYDEFLGGAELALYYGKNLRLEYQFRHFSQFENYQGNKQKAQLLYESNNWSISSGIDFLDASSQLTESKFIIPSIQIKNKHGKDGWTYGGHYSQEKNSRKNISDLTLNAKSIYFEQMGIFVGKQVSEKFNVGVFANKRNDWGIQDQSEEFAFAAVTDELKMNLEWITKKWSNLNFTATIRNLDVVNQEVTNAKSNNGIFGRFNHKFFLLNGGLRTETLIETGSGQEPKQEYRFLEVQQGEGSYIWNDYNLDSLQQVNEFEIAPFGDLGNYERFTVFNNEFIRTTKTEFRQLVDFKLSKFVSRTNKKTKWLGRFYWRTRYHMIKKTMAEQNNFLDAFNFSIDDPAIVSFSNTYDHTLFFNQGSTVFNAEMGYRSIQNKLALISGSEGRSRTSQFARMRYNLLKIIDFSVELERGERKSEAQNYDAKNYTIDYQLYYPKLVWRMSNAFRWTVGYKYTNQVNIGGIERGITKDFGTEITWRRTNKSNLNTGLNYVLNDFNGNPGTPIELDMLEGLKKGNNWVWTINYNQRLGKQIDVNINYSGRQSGTSRTVHTFNGQMKILF